MMSFTKVLHVTGVAMFLGSLLAHVAASQLPDVGTDPTVTLTVCQAIDLAMRFVTLPGLVLAGFSGAFLALMKYFGFLRRRWLVVHQLLGLVVIGITAVVLVPAGGQIHAAATAFLHETGTRYAFAAFLTRAEIFAALNVALALLAIAIGVVKPRLGQTWHFAPAPDAATLDHALKPEHL